MAVRNIGYLVIALGCFTASGCLVSKSNSMREEGVKVSPATLNQITPGETTEAWLIATAGEPSSCRKVDDHTNILRYDHKTVTRKGGAVFLIFAGSERHEKVQSVMFETVDGVVTRYWTES